MTTETSAERLARIKNTKAADYLLTGTSLLGDWIWLIQQAERVQELERQNMRYRRALKHITVFPTNFSHEYHSKRALKIARRVLKEASE